MSDSPRTDKLRAAWPDAHVSPAIEEVFDLCRNIEFELADALKKAEQSKIDALDDFIQDQAKRELNYAHEGEFGVIKFYGVRYIRTDLKNEFIDSIRELFPNAICHMASHNRSSDSKDWHPDHRAIYERAKRILDAYEEKGSNEDA